MCIIRNPIRLFLLIVFGAVKGVHIAINWNISTPRGNSHIEREYKYPMYQEISPAPCDLTDSCDVFCPQDTDCDESQRRSFPAKEPNTRCDDPLAVFDCGCNKFEKPEWLSVFCYVHKNPVYLGKFFETAQKVEKFSTFKNLIGRKRRNMFNKEESMGRSKAKMLYQYGSPIMTFVPMSESFPSVAPLLTKVPLKDFSYGCKLKPVSFGDISSTVCLMKITPELCQNGYVLSVLPYLVQGSNMSTPETLPIVLKDLNVLKGIQTEVTVKCVSLNSRTIKLKKQDMIYFQQENIKPCDYSVNKYQTYLMNNTCQNVLAYVQHDFILNGSDIVKLNVEYGFTDILIDSNDKFSDVNSKYIFLKQKFGVTFFDIMAKSNDKRNFSSDDKLLNRGYFVGEELNFGYKHTENSSTSWEKGLLGVFKYGKSCDHLSPITFGFDHFSACHVGKKFPNCSRLRTAVEEKFDALLQGDALAAYSNLRPPYSNSVPLLRSYPNFFQETSNNFTGCYVPTVQDIRIQYTSTLIEGGRAVHRVLGIRIDRSYENVSTNVDAILTSRALFSFVSSSKGKPLSRFWRRMLSPELSENSWLHILNAFDDVTPAEREEIAFWSILLVLLSSAAVATVKLDFNLGEFS